MLRTIALTAITACLCACASGSAGEAEPEGVRPGELTVLSYLETYQPRTAYLANFEILERSAAILFPTRESEIQPTGPGTHQLPGLVPYFVRAQRDLFSPRATGLLNEPPGRTVEATILAISSDQPLNLAPFLESPGALRDILLEASATNDQQIIAEILRIAIPDPDTVEWRSDIRLVPIPDSWRGEG